MKRGLETDLQELHNDLVNYYHSLVKDRIEESNRFTDGEAHAVLKSIKLVKLIMAKNNIEILQK